LKITIIIATILSLYSISFLVYGSTANPMVYAQSELHTIKHRNLVIDLGNGVKTNARLTYLKMYKYTNIYISKYYRYNKHTFYVILTCVKMKIYSDQHSKTCGFPFKTALTGSEAASWFALTTIRLDYLCSLEAEELPIIIYGGNSSFLWTQQAFTHCADSE
jgi:hypothetical protein